MVVITTDNRDIILDAVRSMYTAVAERPGAGYHFPTGRRACEYVGYPGAELDRVPPAAIESFAGVGYPFAAGVIRPGDVILDIGSGSGTDLILAALLCGPRGRAIGLDMTEAMRRKAAANVRAAGLDNVDLIDGSAESMEGELDLHGFLGLSADIRAGYRELRVAYRVDCDADAGDVDELCAHVQRTSPVLDMLRNNVHVDVARVGS
jgi:SAM-dependent methyltransferase